MTACRVLGPDPDLARRDGFIAALKQRQLPVDAPRVSRWESGMHTLPSQVIATYEQVLGLPEGALTAVTGRTAAPRVRRGAALPPFARP